MAMLGRDVAVWEWLKRSGIVAESDQVTRVIIDIPCEDIVRVYVTKFVDEQAFVVDCSGLEPEIIEAANIQHEGPANDSE